MAHNDLQEPLQSLAAMLNYVVGEAVGEHLPRQGGDGNPFALPLQYVAEVLEVGVAAADGAVLELEGGDVGAANDLVVCVHRAGRSVGLWIADLMRRQRG